MRIEVDDWTKEYFQEIGRQKKQRQEELHYVAGPCKCAECMAKRQQDIREKVLGVEPPGWCPELSQDPNIWDMAKRSRQQRL